MRISARPKSFRLSLFPAGRNLLEMQYIQLGQAVKGSLINGLYAIPVLGGGGGGECVSSGRKWRSES